MVLTLMRYEEELVKEDEYTFPRVEVRKPELAMARSLVEQFADKWDPSQYTDEYRANLMKIIKARLKGKTPKLEEHEEPRQAEVVDLMERLRRSLEGASAQGQRGAKKSAKATKARATSGAGSKTMAKRKRAA